MIIPVSYTHLQYTEERRVYLQKHKKVSEYDSENLMYSLIELSLIHILKDKLARKYEGNSSRKTFSEDNLWKEPYNVLAEYPVILSTTFSSRNSLNSDVVYDYLIMDEASQVDIATGALALSCACLLYTSMLP